MAEATDGSWGYSPEAEQSVLGALLLDSSAFERVAKILEPSHFYTLDHGAIFRCIGELQQRGQVVDITTLGEYMQRAAKESLEAAGGISYLAGLAQSVPSALRVVRYAEIVREKAECRRLHLLALELSQSAQNPGARSARELVTQARQRIGVLAEAVAPGRQIRAASAPELLCTELPTLEPLLAPWLFEKNLVLLHSRRGVGKTHFGLGCAYAIAAGRDFLGWTTPKARGVLYVDGEMPAQLMQRRLQALASAQNFTPELLRIVTPDLQEKAMPDLATAAGQAEVDALVAEETALIVIDNLSCLVRSGGAENESESWGAVAEWALKHRRAGRAVLFIHHSGKTGAQRGTSKREDLLDVVINLRRPHDYQEADGAVFAVHFEKARSLTGDEIAPIEAKLEQLPDGGQVWTYRSAATAAQDQITALWEGGSLTLTDVYREAGCAKSHAHRTLEAAMAAGKLKRPYPSKPRKTGS
jgi:hypothetical protein